MASALTRVAPPALRPALLPRRIALCVPPRYFSQVPPRWNASTTAISTQPVEVPSAEVQPERDDGDPMEIEEKEWENDDFTSSGHAELERHREARQYARVTMYEMPRLSELAKPFVHPTSSQVLRFRYTTYLGEKHPAESKVVVEFAPEALELTPVQTEKLIKIAGVRYNPGTRVVKMSCEMFEQQAQNKRYLSDLVDTLIEEAKDPTDDFSDVPVDFRHYTTKLRPPKPKFPARWRLTERRRESLTESRMALKELFGNTGGSA